jgi:hypothetical protein
VVALVCRGLPSPPCGRFDFSGWRVGDLYPFIGCRPIGRRGAVFLFGIFLFGISRRGLVARGRRGDDARDVELRGGLRCDRALALRGMAGEGGRLKAQ